MELRKYTIGQKVRAKGTVTEDGTGDGDPNAKFPAGNYIHATDGEEGEVVHTKPDGTEATVRFARSGTATLVADSEIKEGNMSNDKETMSEEDKKGRDQMVSALRSSIAATDKAIKALSEDVNGAASATSNDATDAYLAAARDKVLDMLVHIGDISHRIGRNK